MDLSQILALVIFILMYAAIIIGKVHRMIPALLGAACTLLIVFLGIQRNPNTAYSVLNINDLWRHSF